MLVELQRRASLVGYPDPIRSLMASQPELIARSLRHEWFTADQVRVATKGEHIVGFAVLERSESREAEVVALFVNPVHWRTGVGRALVNAVVALATQWGNARIWVLANPLALDFYAAAGFLHNKYVDMPNASAVPRLTLDVHSDTEMRKDGTSAHQKLR